MATNLPSDPASFRRMVDVVGDGTGFKPDPWQDADFRAADNAWLRAAGFKVPPGPQRFFLTRPRGHSKTSDIALMLLWLAYHAHRPASAVCCAADVDQAGLLIQAATKLVRQNPWLERTIRNQPAVEIQRDRILGHATGVDIRVMASDVGSSYGITPDVVIADEITHWSDKGERLWDSLFSSAAKRPNCLLLLIGNAGTEESWQGRLASAVRHDPAWVCRHLDGPQASWLKPAILEEQKRLLPGPVYERLWLNQWQSGSGNLFERDDIQAITTLPGPCLERRPGWVHYAGLDLGISRDATALVIVGKHVGFAREVPAPQVVQANSTVRILADLGMIDAPPRETKWERELATGRLQLEQVRIWKPNKGNKVDLQQIETELIELHRRLGIRLVIDAWQAELLSQRLRQAGVPVRPVQATSSVLQEQASLIQDAIRERTLSLFPHGDLATDIVRLKLVDRGTSYRLESPRVGDGAGGTRHGDSASALMLALYATRLYPQTVCTNRTLVYN